MLLFMCLSCLFVMAFASAGVVCLAVFCVGVWVETLFAYFGFLDCFVFVICAL